MSVNSDTTEQGLIPREKISRKCRIKFFAKYFSFKKIEFENLPRLIPDVPKENFSKKKTYLFSFHF